MQQRKRPPIILKTLRSPVKAGSTVYTRYEKPTFGRWLSVWTFEDREFLKALALPACIAIVSFVLPRFMDVVRLQFNVEHP